MSGLEGKSERIRGKRRGGCVRRLGSGSRLEGRRGGGGDSRPKVTMVTSLSQVLFLSLNITE